MVKYLGIQYGTSEQGWTDQELFLFWLKYFLNYANPGCPLLLLLDGHSSHFELGTIELAKEKDVFFWLLPHTTHRSQPLDSCVFGPVIIVLIAIHLFLDTMQYF